MEGKNIFWLGNNGFTAIFGGENFRGGKFSSKNLSLRFAKWLLFGEQCAKLPFFCSFHANRASIHHYSVVSIFLSTCPANFHFYFSSLFLLYIFLVYCFLYFSSLFVLSIFPPYFSSLFFLSIFRLYFSLNLCRILFI